MKNLPWANILAMAACVFQAARYDGTDIQHIYFLGSWIFAVMWRK